VRSLQSRLVLTAVALVAVAALLIGAITTVAMRSWLTDRLDADVTHALERASRPLGGGPPMPPPVNDGQFEQRSGQAVGTLMAVVDDDFRHGEVITDDGRTRLSTTAMGVLAELPADGEVREVSLPGVGDYRVAAGQAGADTVVAGLPTAEVDDVVSSLLWWQALLGLLGVAAAAGVGVVVVRRQLAPLREVAATAHEVAALPLASGEIEVAPRVAYTDEGTEVGQVGAALNTLLAHVETSLAARHRSEQQVRRFVADASHELRTPLATIRGYAELARRTPDDPAPLGQALGKVESEAGRMSTLVEDLLLLARLDAGRPLAADEVDVTRLLLEAVADARVLAPGHHFRLDLPDDVLSVTGDEDRLHQVVTNLLTNARKHTPPGTTITVSARPAGPDGPDGPGGRGVEVVVADDGPGFPAELTATAFQRFTRGDVARTGSGSGLGLSIVDAIVRAHGGTVRLDSVPGDTRITVALPGLTGA